MPGAADHGDPLAPGRQFAPDRLAHPGLAPAVVVARTRPAAQLVHRLADLVERQHRVAALLPLLDRVLPPRLRVVVAREPRERPDRVAPGRGPRVLLGLFAVVARRRLAGFARRERVLR